MAFLGYAYTCVIKAASSGNMPIYYIDHLSEREIKRGERWGSKRGREGVRGIVRGGGRENLTHATC